MRRRWDVGVTSVTASVLFLSFLLHLLLLLFIIIIIIITVVVIILNEFLVLSFL